MIPRVAAFLSLGLALAGCASEGGPPSVSSATSIMPVAYAIEADSAGPITATTSYSRQALQALFPGDRIDVIQTADETGVVSALTIFEEGLQTLMVIPTSNRREIKAVHGAGLAVAGPGGERLGMTFRELGMDRGTCRLGQGPWVGMAVCRSRQAPNVSLVFDPGEWSEPNELAPAEVLAEGRLQRIVWSPPGA
ncbi:DUF1131 family protein [Lutibaculum baratangense]|uniref:DUF1131 domain-containing protein n=1 Tax=Lutibaculum baratangense AMV1 TaxID=631454 RepID=V4T817_9HYPH|nr:DUF1131 family protein [Lutibaculum baratangense]ESR22743.1 hypothetical protein N177_3880 [Lutibaculum baratangense AMV1]